MHIIPIEIWGSTTKKMLCWWWNRLTSATLNINWATLFLLFRSISVRTHGSQISWDSWTPSSLLLSSVVTEWFLLPKKRRPVVFPIMASSSPRRNQHWMCWWWDLPPLSYLVWDMTWWGSGRVILSNRHSWVSLTFFLATRLVTLTMWFWSCGRSALHTGSSSLPRYCNIDCWQ